MILAARALELNGLALCDLDGMYGAVRAWKAHQDAQKSTPHSPFQYIVGAELTLCYEASLAGVPCVPMHGTALTVALIVQNSRGYENLCRLLTKSHNGQEKGQSVCDSTWFAERNEGLYALLIAPHDPLRLHPKVHKSSVVSALKSAFLANLQSLRTAISMVSMIKDNAG